MFPNLNPKTCLTCLHFSIPLNKFIISNSKGNHKQSAIFHRFLTENVIDLWSGNLNKWMNNQDARSKPWLIIFCSEQSGKWNIQFFIQLQKINKVILSHKKLFYNKSKKIKLLFFLILFYLIIRNINNKRETASDLKLKFKIK